MRPPPLLLLTLLLVPNLVLAETVYVDDKLMVGFHQEKSADSTIIKLVPGGTALELIKQDTPLTQVRDPDGTVGWVDNKYLIKIAPGREQLQAAEQKITGLEAEIARLQSGAGTGNQAIADGDLAKENEEFKQLLKSERLKVGELQAQVVELKSKLGQQGNGELSEQLAQLTQENTALLQQIEELQAATTAVPSPVKNLNLDIGEFNWKKMLITIAISLVLGLVAGIYILDLVIRRRHGGFRV